MGQLACTLTDVKNRIVTSKEVLACTLTRPGGQTDRYTGEVRRVGVDLTVKSDMVILWSLLAATEDAASRNSIAGTYVGGGAEAAVGAGVGAKVLVGGGAEAFTLNPVSVSGVGGAGASLGVERLRLSHGG